MSQTLSNTTIDTLIFDMDGVITTEEKYWACARLTLWELVTETLGLAQAFDPAAIHNSEAREAVVSDKLIYALKSRAVNSNWDIAYVLACVYLTALPSAANLAMPGATIPQALAAIKSSIRHPTAWPEALSHFLENSAPIDGRALIELAGARFQTVFGLTDASIWQPDGSFWWYLHERFQRWYRGEAFTERSAQPLADGTVIPAEALHVTLHTLRDRGYTMGVATGRPHDELNDALGSLGLLAYFDAKRLGTLDRVRQAEAESGQSGLSKPHPFSLLRALYPEADTKTLLREEFQKRDRPNVAMIGDSTSDVLMAQATGCRPIAVLTGVRGAEAKAERRQLLIECGSEVILNDVTELPGWLEKQRRS